jgi:hypothetical protein
MSLHFEKHAYWKRKIQSYVFNLSDIFVTYSCHKYVALQRSEVEAFALIIDAMREWLEACISLFAADVSLFLVLSASHVPDPSDKSRNMYPTWGTSTFFKSVL